MLIRNRLLRRFFLDFECFAGAVSVAWGVIAFGSRLTMAERPNLAGLAFLTDDEWALLMCCLGGAQVAAVLANERWSRWLVAIPLTWIWSSVAVQIGWASCAGESLPQAAAFYFAMPVFLLLKVASMPREYPPRG